MAEEQAGGLNRGQVAAAISKQAQVIEGLSEELA
jgi:hypothetical protein